MTNKDYNELKKSDNINLMLSIILNNLMNYNRDLKKEIEELKEENQWLQGQLNSAFDRGFIHKSKIKEKIEELKEIADEDNKEEYIKISVLKELLESE